MLTYCAYGALLVCLVGIGYRVYGWLKVQVGPEAGRYTMGQRTGGVLSAVVMAVFQPRALIKVLRAFFLEVVLQLHILKQSPRRWMTHMALCYGMLLLVLFHFHQIMSET